MSKFQITATVDEVIKDRTGQWVNGKRVYFTILDYDEAHSVTVPNLDEKTVKAAIDKVVTQRDSLAALTGEVIKK